MHTSILSLPTSADYHFIVIGNPIAHSKSPELHQSFAKQTGLNIHYARQLCPNDFDSFVAVAASFFNGGGTGLNITVPFKEMAFELCQTLSQTNQGNLSEYALVAGAVNTLAIKDGKLYGDNTDGRGLVADLRSKGVDLDSKNVVILGAGGATRGAILPLLNANVKSLHIANRTVEKAENLAKMFDDNRITFSNLTDLPNNVDVIINATSIGLSGEKLPFNDDLTTDFAYDMMYGKPSAFLDFFKAKNANISDGLGMLVNQGALSFELWTGEKVNLTDFTF
ncbi:shikimate dehydrogenase [Faucicola mancuniensis]|uniref:shikimate dehydrogenase n=1 Tax=Faucicola mancuniensis TaxID=1309795 RepID=UPI0039776A34